DAGLPAGSGTIPLRALTDALLAADARLGPMRADGHITLRCDQLTTPCPCTRLAWDARQRAGPNGGQRLARPQEKDRTACRARLKRGACRRVTGHAACSPRAA